MQQRYRLNGCVNTRHRSTHAHQGSCVVSTGDAERALEAVDERAGHRVWLARGTELAERHRHASEVLTIVATDQNIGLVDVETVQQDRSVLQHGTVATQL